MKTYIIALIAFLCIAGCKTPDQSAYAEARVVVEAVDLSLQQWAEYVVKEERAIAALSPADRGSREADLLRKEGRVILAYGEYRSILEKYRNEVDEALLQRKPVPRLVMSAAKQTQTLIKELSK